MSRILLLDSFKIAVRKTQRNHEEVKVCLHCELTKAFEAGKMRLEANLTWLDGKSKVHRVINHLHMTNHYLKKETVQRRFVFKDKVMIMIMKVMIVVIITHVSYIDDNSRLSNDQLSLIKVRRTENLSKRILLCYIFTELRLPRLLRSITKSIVTIHRNSFILTGRSGSAQRRMNWENAWSRRCTIRPWFSWSNAPRKNKTIIFNGDSLISSYTPCSNIAKVAKLRLEKNALVVNVNRW